MQIVQPYQMEITDWFDNLIIDFPNENLPILNDPDRWYEIAEIIAIQGVFAKVNCRMPQVIEKDDDLEYEDWTNWASDLYANVVFYKDKKQKNI